MGNQNFDFSGFVTKNNVRCGDGTIIREGCFAHNDGAVVPLVWNHAHDDPDYILGNAKLENRKEGVYARCSFNGNSKAIATKELLAHGDIVSMSIYANHLRRRGDDIYHGDIKEVSLVLAGSDPTAIIDQLSFAHSEGYEDGDDDFDAIIYTGELLDNEVSIQHSDEKKEDEPKEEPMSKEDTKKPEEAKKEDEEEALDPKKEFDAMTDKQKAAVYAIAGQILEDAKSKESDDDDDKEEDSMAHNIFENDQQNMDEVLTHSDVQEILSDAKNGSSLKAELKARGLEGISISHSDVEGSHTVREGVTYGVQDINFLFPEAHELNGTPDFIKREAAWVSQFMGKVHHTPFSRIKTTHADITMDEARALGYIKGNQKKDEVFTLLRRTTDPQTVFKRQKLDRDDVIDITDFDVVAWIKAEMRGQLDEELVRAMLVGDGRLADSQDKISESHIRPIYTDNELYSIHKTVTYANNATDDEKAKAFIRAAVKARIDYKGSGSPFLYTTEEALTNMLLMEDEIGHPLYASVQALATALRVSGIVTVPVMEGLTRTATIDGTEKTLALDGIIVNPADYNVGADKGGAITNFDDFDINFNQMIYLIETRCSGALIKPKSAIVLEHVQA